MNDGHIHFQRRKRDHRLATIRIVNHLHIGPHLQHVRSDPALSRHEAHTGQGRTQAKGQARFRFFDYLQIALRDQRGEHGRQAERFQPAVARAQRLDLARPDQHIAFVGRREIQQRQIAHAGFEKFTHKRHRPAIQIHAAERERVAAVHKFHGFRQKNGFVDHDCW